MRNGEQHRVPGSGTGLICKAADENVAAATGRGVKINAPPAPTVKLVAVGRAVVRGQDQRAGIHGRAAAIRVRAAEDQQPAAVFGKRHAGTVLADAAGKRQAAADGHAGIQIVGKRQGGRDRMAAAHHRHKRRGPGIVQGERAARARRAERIAGRRQSSSWRKSGPRLSGDRPR